MALLEIGRSLLARSHDFSDDAQILAERVVHFLGDALPLAFLGRDQLAGERFLQLVQPPQAPHAREVSAEGDRSRSGERQRHEPRRPPERRQDEDID